MLLNIPIILLIGYFGELEFNVQMTAATVHNDLSEQLSRVQSLPFHNTLLIPVILADKLKMQGHTIVANTPSSAAINAF